MATHGKRVNASSRIGSSDRAEATTAFGTLIADRTAEERAREVEERAGALTPERLLVGVCFLSFIGVCIVQVVNLPLLLDPAEPLTAGLAWPTVAGVTLAEIGLIGAAALLPRRYLHLPVAVSAAFASLVLVATLTLGGEAWSLATAVLTISACWLAGTWTLRALRMPGLAELPPVAWLAGTAVVALSIQLLGRAALLRWWTAGIVVLTLGGVGLYRLARDVGPRAAAVWAALTEGRLAAGCSALILLLLGLAAIWTAAPEVMYDALYLKAWLPAEWARTGEITPLRDHVFLNLHGYTQELAVPGHLFGAEGVGRYLQWLAAGLIPASLWWFLRSRTRWAPLAAAAVAVTPALFWQATTAYDDALLMLAAIGLAVAVVAVLEHPRKAALWEGVAIGVLAGAAVDLKLHLGWLAVGLTLAYIAFRPAPRLRALAGLTAGGLVTAGPPLLIRWLDIGNPVFPALTNVFHSPYWIAIGAGGGGSGAPEGPWILGKVLWNSFVSPASLGSRVPIGTYGLLTLALTGSLAVGAAIAVRRRSRALIGLWGALALALFGWYLQSRYQMQLKGLRYLMPTTVVAVLMLGLAGQRLRLTGSAERTSLAAVAVVAILLWPATLAPFWNVPGKDVPLASALGLKSDFEYERQSQSERAAIAAFNAASPPGAKAVSFRHQRAWLTGGRDLLMWWELHRQLLLNGATLPSEPEEALRRIRATGADWVLVETHAPVSRQQGFFYIFGAIARYGELRWADDEWSLFYLSDKPRTPTPFPACDDLLAGVRGCWQGTLDGRAGYASRDGGPSITRTVPVCPGQLLTLRIRAEGVGLAGAAINFDGPQLPAGAARSMGVEGGVDALVGKTAPPGSTRGIVTLSRPGPGLTISQADLGHAGACESPGGGASTRSSPPASSVPEQAPVPPAAPTPHLTLSAPSPIGPPPVREGITEAKRRIAAAIASGDCERINPLYVLSSGLRQPERSCENLITLEEWRPTAAAAYGEEGAVIDYSTGSRTASLVLVRDLDGLLHIAYLTRRATPTTTVGTPLARPDAAANAVVEAMRTKDCGAFIEVVNREEGIGSLPGPLTCRVFEHQPLQAGLFQVPNAEPEPLGGNATFAFYGVGTPIGYYVIVLQRSDESGQYGYTNSYLTNASGSPED